MASITIIQSPANAFKKTSTPNAKRKIATVLDQENVQHIAHSSPSKAVTAAAGSLSTTATASPINVAKKAFTGTNVNVTALSNKANIINNQQQPPPKATKSVSVIKALAVNNGTTGGEVKPGKTALPQAVARRNARERNRVKQVNNGFAALRQHIPEEMAEAFEQQKGSSANVQPVNNQSNSAQKKLSKVETLRMAVEYIKNLESLLNLTSSHHHHVNDHSFSFCDTSSIVSNSPSSPSFSNSSMIDEEPSLHPQPCPLSMSFDGGDSGLSIDQSNVVLPSVTTINGIPYLRLPQTNHHQLNLGHGYVDPATGDFVLVSSDLGNDEVDLQMQQDQLMQQQQQVVYQTGMDHQQIILYAPSPAVTTAASPPATLENNFQSNFVSNNLLAPAPYRGGTATATAEEFNGGVDAAAADDECSGQSTGLRSPVPGGVVEDRIKIEQQPSRGATNNCPSSSASPSPSLMTPVYVNTSGLISGQQAGYEHESPPKRHCTSNEQFSVVNQSGVIIRGSFIEIKQERSQPQFVTQQLERSSPGILAPVATNESMYDNIHERLLQIKTEIGDEDTNELNMLDSVEITEEHMIDAMEWWENEKRTCNNSN